MNLIENAFHVAGSNHWKDWMYLIMHPYYTDKTACMAEITSLLCANIQLTLSHMVRFKLWGNTKQQHQTNKKCCMNAWCDDIFSVTVPIPESNREKRSCLTSAVISSWSHMTYWGKQSNPKTTEANVVNEQPLCTEKLFYRKKTSGWLKSYCAPQVAMESSVSISFSVILFMWFSGT